MAVLSSPVVLLSSALKPLAVLKLPVLFREGTSTVGGVEKAGGVETSAAVGFAERPSLQNRWPC